MFKRNTKYFDDTKERLNVIFMKTFFQKYCLIYDFIINKFNITLS
ncbi:hypothetical protein ACUXJ9_000915 [Staphylococcus caledonicus]